MNNCSLTSWSNEITVQSLMVGCHGLNFVDISRLYYDSACRDAFYGDKRFGLKMLKFKYIEST